MTGWASPKEEPFHNALDDALYTAKICRKLPLAEGLATYPTEEELLTEALLGSEKTGCDVQLFMNRLEHDDYRNLPELYKVNCPECGAPLTNDEVWLKRGNTGYFTRSSCPYCGHWYLRFKLSRRDGLHWSLAAAWMLPPRSMMPNGISRRPPCWNAQSASRNGKTAHNTEKAPCGELSIKQVHETNNMAVAGQGLLTKRGMCR